MKFSVALPSAYEGLGYPIGMVRDRLAQQFGKLLAQLSFALAGIIQFQAGSFQFLLNLRNSRPHLI